MTIPRRRADAETFFDRIADDFDAKMNQYDVERRVRIIFDELLPEDLKGMRLLDAGCGTGRFSVAAVERGARVVSLDLSPRLAKLTGRKCQSAPTVADACELPFSDATFDAVISSEMIEHVPDPSRALAELLRVLRPGGILALTTPNWAWKWSVLIANRFGIRPFEGLENWVGYRELAAIVSARADIEIHRGFHLFPFQLTATQPLLRYLDRFGDRLGPVMINQAIRARKR